MISVVEMSEKQGKGKLHTHTLKTVCTNSWVT